MKRISIFFYILLIFLQVQCGTTYLLFDSYEKSVKEDTDLSPLLTLLGSGGLVPLNVEPISWVNLSVSSLSFARGATGNFMISVDHPGSCPDASFRLDLSNDGVPLTFLNGTDLDTDGCPLNVLYTQTYNITGTVAGNGRVIVKMSPLMFYTTFPGLYVGQIVGVVNVTVSPNVSTSSTP
ncbi:hypothetical protein [Leptospira haakeii]|uniref:Uncharacterized protein n=1 Tax=Leptospira haakeii TaxID=2023198 RepID=A0ABX4PMA9_9LEPT|nr:hypothetical protein [Leptospira haakeii]PKA16743.1 hypothetical protein CH363_08245 [Leptospira haakeii]PKA20764.1 hypothetical protein CH377_07650 [Leptospira haakeii]